MPITVGELLQMPHLGLRLHSGGQALGRPVAWTHTSDLPQPWRWVTGGELLMTNGMSMPSSAEGQVGLITELVEHGCAALAIGEDMYCPPLTEQLGEVSEALSFPVLWIAFPMPFVAISRTVAEATLLEQSDRLLRTERIYQALPRISADGGHTVTAALTREMNCPLHVCERSTGDPWFPGAAPLAPDARAAVAARRGRVRGGVLAVPLGTEAAGVALLADVPTHADAVLVALPPRGRQPDALLLQHAATVTALALSQTRLTVEHRRRTGEELLSQMLDGQIAPSLAQRHLHELGIEVAAAVCVAVRHGEPARVRDLHVSLWRSGLPHVTAHRPAGVLAVVRGDPAAMATMSRAVGVQARIGVSSPLERVERIVDAERESVWAARTGVEHKSSITFYGEATPWLGARTPADARALVDHVLRGVLDLPTEQAGDLIATLHAFLTHGRSWQRTAQALHVHRQTVLYRVRKVEELTGCQVSDTGDLAALWLALQANDMLRGPGAG